MIMKNCTLFSFVLGMLASCTTVAETYCSGNSTYLYTECESDYRDMTLWCDSMNLTSILQPKTINALGPVERTATLHHNFTCLRTLEPDKLETYPFLIKANFDSNSITEVASNTFKHNTQLKVLVLSNNGITSVAENTFLPNNVLTIFILSNNPIASLPRFTVNRYPHLELLDISNTNLFKIQSQFFFIPTLITILGPDDVSILGNDEEQPTLLCEDSYINSSSVILTTTDTPTQMPDIQVPVTLQPKGNITINLMESNDTDTLQENTDTNQSYAIVAAAKVFSVLEMRVVLLHTGRFFISSDRNTNLWTS